MQPFNPKKREGKEALIRTRIITRLRMLGWYVKIMHGNEFQSGFPDLFACHSRYGIRLIEVKNPEKYSFTAAQLEDFPKISANGGRIWVLTDDTECEINKLFGPQNWMMYLKW